MRNCTKDIKVTLTAVLGTCEVPVSQVDTLEEGSILELTKLAGEPTDIYAGDVLVGKGEVIVVGDSEKFGIRVVEVKD